MTGVLAIVAGAWDSLTGASVGALGVAVVLHVGKLAAEARAWHWIVRHAEGTGDVPFRTTCGAFACATGVNAVVPARVGDVLRVGVVRRHAPDSCIVTIAATLALETVVRIVFGVFTIGAVLVVSAVLSPEGATASLAGLFATPAAVALPAVAAAGAGLVWLFLGHRVRSVLSQVAGGFAIVRSPRLFAARVLSWRVVAWTLRLGAVYAFLVAFHVPAALWTVLVVVAAQSVAAFLPLLPGNAGTQQAAIAIALAGSVSASSLVGFGIGMQATTAAVDVALGAAALALVAGPGDVRAALGTLRPARLRRAVS